MAMKIFRCSDMGNKCRFVAKGRTVASIKKKVMVHVKKVHKAMLMKMTAAQKKAMMRKISKVIKTIK